MLIFLNIVFWTIFVVMVLKLVSTFVSIFSGSPSGETSSKIIKKLFKQIDPKKNSVIYDLGSGLGNVGIAIVKNFPVKVIGYEISPLPYLTSKIRSLFVKNFTVKYANVKKANISDANVVYCYLLPGLLSEIAPKLTKELPKNTKIISLLFEIKGLKKQKTIEIDGNKFHIYIV